MIINPYIYQVNNSGMTITDTSMTYLSNQAVFNGSTSKITIANSSDLSFTNGTNDLPFTIDIRFTPSYFNGALSGVLVEKVSPDEYQILIAYNKLRVMLFNLTDSLIGAEFDYTFIVGVTYRLTIVYNSNMTSSGIQAYLNGVPMTWSNIPAAGYTYMTPQSAPVTIGRLFYGTVDYCAIYNKVLSQDEINKGISDLSFYSGSTDLPFSLSKKYNFSSNTNVSWFNKSNGTNVEYSIKYDTVLGIVITLRDNTNNAQYVYTKLFTPILNTNYAFAFTHPI